MNQFIGFSGLQRAFYAGDGLIGGQSPGLLTVAGLPAKRQIFLYVRPFKRPPYLIDAIWSNDDGTYAFDMLDRNQKYLMVAVDHEAQYEPVAWDYITPANRNE